MGYPRALGSSATVVSGANTSLIPLSVNTWPRLCARAPCNASLLHIETETSLHFCEVFTHSAQHEGSIHTWQGRFVELSSPALRKLCVHLLSFARLSWLSVLGAPS